MARYRWHNRFDPTPLHIPKIEIVDPSLVLSRWGRTLFVQAAQSSFSIPTYVAPSLARFINESPMVLDSRMRDDHRGKDPALLAKSWLGLPWSEVTDSLRAFKDTLDLESPDRLVVSPPFTAPQAEGDDADRYRMVLHVLERNFMEDEGDFVERAFLEQIAICAAQPDQDVRVIARCQSEPAFWKYLKKKGIVDTKEITEEEWLKDEVADKMQWLRLRGIHELAYAGVTFGFVSFMFPDPTLLKTSVVAGLQFAKAIYVDP